MIMTETLAKSARQVQQARDFAALHIKGQPVELYNIWDAGSAKAVEAAGVAALATGSWSVAAAQGYADGEALPLDVLLAIVRRITANTDLPLTVDFETGFAPDKAGLTANIEALIEAGAIGLNLEDQIIGAALRPAAEQADRIAIVRDSADIAGVPLFINARTDLFLRAKDGGEHAGLVSEAIDRGQHYAAAGANSLFVPGLGDPDLIRRVCDDSTLPVNVMMMPGMASIAELAACGVARISHGPFPYMKAMETLTAEAKSTQGRGAD